MIKYVRLHGNYATDASLETLLETLSRAKKQREAVLSFFQLSANKKPIKAKDLEAQANVSSTILKSLVDKDVFEFYHIQIDRIVFKGDTNSNYHSITGVFWKSNLCFSFKILHERKGRSMEKCFRK